VYTKPLQAYQEIDKSGMSGREVEAFALTKAAMALRECQTNWNGPDSEQMLEHALKLNQRVWSIFQAEVTRADSEMPMPIKNNILSLGAYIDQRSLKVIADPNPKALDIIIAINENLAAGLRQTVHGQPEESENNNLIGI
jgi:flagellar biosynthesis activator protein FlaF